MQVTTDDILQVSKCIFGRKVMVAAQSIELERSPADLVRERNLGAETANAE